MISPTAPYSENTHLCQQCLQKQEGNITFHSRSDPSRLGTVASKTQARDLTGKTIPAQPHSFNTFTGTFSICPADNTVYDKD